MKRFFFLVLTLSFLGKLSAQNYDNKIKSLLTQQEKLNEEQRKLSEKIENLELEKLKFQLRPVLPKILPDERLIEHSLMFLVYSDLHEQAKWVAHVISPKIIKGQVSRTNDFRRDPKIKSGSATEGDYFLKSLKSDSTYEYDGFGYDRGHLAPSADFRWSEKALSESYYYSNMSPQLPEFNREIWADLENAIRGYVFRNPDSELYVVTGPVLYDDLPSIERSINQVSIPNMFFKVVLDQKNKRMAGFLFPHRGTNDPLHKFMVPVDQIEAMTGIDFAARLKDPLEDALEKQVEPKTWLGEEAANAVSPLYAPDLPKNHFNTTQAKRFMGSNEEVSVCGTVVDARLSRSKNVLMNLDRKYPDQVFTVFIRKENIVNFGEDPVTFWVDKKVCATGKVVSLSGTPAIFLDHEHQLSEYK